MKKNLYYKIGDLGNVDFSGVIANNNEFELLHRTDPRHNHGTIFKFQKH